MEIKLHKKQIEWLKKVGTVRIDMQKRKRYWIGVDIARVGKDYSCYRTADGKWRKY